MKNITANKNKKTGNINAQVVLAEINAQIETLNQKRVALAEPLKDRYAVIRGQLVALYTEIRSIDVEWKPEPMKPKAETKITEILTANRQPMSAEDIVKAVGDLFTPGKVKSTLKKKSTGAKA